jgi:phosphoheptose isomerase
MDFSSIFKQQLKLLGRRGDVLICISASGNSTNLIEAVLEAKNMGVLTVAITGFDGGRLREVCDISVHTPTRIGSYGIVEDIHSTVSHVLTEVIRSL